MTTSPTPSSRLDTTLYSHRLPNGLQMLGQYMPGVESATAVFWVRTGARDELDEQAGVSHFLEHMAFKRTKTRTYADINREFQEMGAENNAFTWVEMTAFWARVLHENLAWAIDVLTELTHPVLDAADFEQERHVILEEIALYQDRPFFLLIEHFLQDFFKDQPLGHSTLGTPDTIGRLTVADMRSYWARRYGASNILFSVAGNFEWDQVVDQLSSLTGDWETGTNGREQAPAHYAPRIDIMENARWQQEHIAIGMPSIARDDPRRYVAAVLATALGDDTGSRLFWAVQQTGLAQDVSAQAMAFAAAGTLLVTASTDPGKAVETLQVIQRELETLQRENITEDELERAKIKLATAVVIGGESNRERAMALIESWLSEGRLRTLADVQAGIDSVTREDIRNLLDDFPLTDTQVLTALGPLSRSKILS